MGADRHPPMCRLTEVFDGEDFGALDAARAWLRARGLELGSLKRGHPTAVMWRGQWGGGSSKWTHIYADSMAALPGYLEGNNRDGPLSLYLSAGTLLALGLEGAPG